MQSLGVDGTRVDKWLWAVRLYSSRTASSDACSGGHVRVNDAPAKASTIVRVGNTVTATAGGRERVLEVAKIIEKRVGAAIAAECFLDHSPPPPSREEYVAPMFTRERGSGRPTKRDRRQLDRFRSR